MSELYKIPNNYRSEELEINPLFLIGYNHFFYFNSENLLDDGDFNNWTFSIFDNSGSIVADNIGTLTKDVISGSDYVFYTNFLIPDTVIPNVYQFVIYNNTNNAVIFQSDCIGVISVEDVYKYPLFEYRNSTNLYSYNYNSLNNYNNVFLPVNLIDQQPEIELKQTKEQSTGKVRTQKVDTSKTLILETFYFDDQSNDMILALSAHDDIKINNKVVTVKTGYKIEPYRYDSLQKGVIEFYDEEYSTVNLKG